MTIKTGEVLFLDTSVLLTATDESRPQHAAAGRVLTSAVRAGVHLGLSGQILREYLVAATRPVERNGLGLLPEQALANVGEFRRRALVYAEDDAVSLRLGKLVREAGVRGKRIHDANVAATMLVHGISVLVTDNPDDFAPFAGIRSVSADEAFCAVRALLSPGG
jgi:predicted nucleic acid-binding protein